VDEIRGNVEELLLTVVDYKSTDWDQFIKVRNELINMIIVSVAPPITPLSPDSVTRERSFSEKKESFIAP
jgi:hypothetical protein